MTALCSRFAVAFGVLLLALVATSSRRPTGDAVEYVTIATQVTHLRIPTLNPADAKVLGLFVPSLIDRHGQQELWHFWLFSWLASPVVGSALALGFSAVSGFMLFNAVLLFFVFRRVCIHFGVWPAAFLFVSPLLWWTDKAQVEVFTVALLALAFTYERRLSLAALCCALASTQNPPLAVGVGYAMLLAATRGPDVRGPMWAWWVSGVLVALHPAYYLWQLGRLSPLVSGGILLPVPRLLFSPLVDLNMGLLWTAPLFVATVLVSALIAPPTRRTAVATAAAILFLLFSFAQAANVNSGGTPSLDRYALWLLPLALQVVGSASYSVVVRSLITASMIASIAMFHPRRAESYLEPSSLALAVWTRHPGWDDPPAEVFAERIRHQDGAHTLAATDGCEKVLLTNGQWPAGCSIPPGLPTKCLTGICYANRGSAGVFTFVRTARRPGYRIALAWP